ncbi:hypothetical protein CSUB01_12316 [Colletotrichum sublineola]|uniref:Uncharacterized protein n=1 Tax=Colletotrichum sublineola TaxID=1173701 RepID=A0A066X6E1_COLSU|nr:hypothetical protein CSUB01_12316 [Colletotrichum sublineola]
MTPEEEVNMVRQSTKEAEEIPQEGQYKEEGIYAIRQGDAQEAKDTIDPYPVPRAYTKIRLSLRARQPPLTYLKSTAKPKTREQREDTQFQQASSYRNPSFKLPPPSSENSAQASPTPMTVMVKRSQDRESTTPTAQFNSRIVPSNSPTSRQLTNLIKLYSNNPTSKYTGSQYETINSKLPTFYKLYDRVRIPTSRYRAAVIIMLSSNAQEYYSINLRRFTGDFNALIANIKSEFKGDEVHSARIAELRRITFESIARNNPRKSKREILNLLIKKVTQLVRATTRNSMPKDEEYRNTLINYCRGVPEYAVALLSPPATYNALYAQLRNGVANTILFPTTTVTHSRKQTRRVKTREIEATSQQRGASSTRNPDASQPSIPKKNATLHAITKDNPREEETAEEKPTTDKVFTFNDQYSAATFQGIMPDTGAARVSTVSQQQYTTLKRHLNRELPLDTSRAGEATIRFGSGNHFKSTGTVEVPTPVGNLTFHVMDSNTPFLFCLKDMDRHRVKFNNLTNTLVKGDTIVPVVRKWGHTWMLLEQPKRTVAQHHLTDGKLQQIHRRFSHPSVQHLHKVL